MGLVDSVAKNRLEGLRALRDVLAEEIMAGPPGDKSVSQTAALARQLRDTLRDIEELEKAVPKGSVVDDLSRRRKSRQSRSARAAKAAGGGSK